MTKLTWSELCSKIYEHNKLYRIDHQFSDKKPLICVVVYKESNFDRIYSLESRSYKFRSDNKYFIHNLIGNNIIASSLNEDDLNVRLDWYNDWKIDYCYIIEE